MKIIGHRGARGLAPENTLASIQAAIDHKVDAVEFDVRVTSDGIPILIHDEHLADTSGVELEVAKTSYQNLLNVNSNLATLDQVFVTVNHQVTLMIEVKPSVEVSPVAKVIKRHLENGWKTSELCVASYSDKVLLHFKAELPEVERVVIERWSGVRAHFRVRRVKATSVSMNQRWLWWGFIQSVRHSGYKLNAYTLNDPSKAKRWAKHGLAGTITDYPDRFET